MGTYRWRTVDIVVTSVLAVAFGVVFWAWNLFWSGPADAIPLPAKALLNGVWLLPAVLGGLVIRKPGAALYCEFLAAVVSAILGAPWATVPLQGLLQGLAAELVFLAFGYRVFSALVASLAAVGAGLAAGVFEIIFFYRDYAWTTFRLPYVLFVVLSSVAIAGFGGWTLTRSLARTGVLDQFPSGRERNAV